MNTLHQLIGGQWDGHALNGLVLRERCFTDITTTFYDEPNATWQFHVAVCSSSHPFHFCFLFDLAARSYFNNSNEPLADRVFVCATQYCTAYQYVGNEQIIFVWYGIIRTNRRNSERILMGCADFRKIGRPNMVKYDVIILAFPYSPTSGSGNFMHTNKNFPKSHNGNDR